MVQINDNTKYVIGIDFGHGETAAAVYDISLKGKPEKINIIPGKEVVPSAIAIILQEGRKTVVIGEEAIDWIESSRQTEKFQISFKKRPSLMNAEEKALMVAFMKGVYNGIRRENVTLNDCNHVVFIARPSNRSWDKEEQLYVTMAAEAGIPIAGAYKESIAAYYRARTTAFANIDEHVKKGGVLVVDYGSSTIDFTYLNNSLTQPCADGTEGTELGAATVEAMIMCDFLTKCKKDEFQKFNRLYGHNPLSNSYNVMLYHFRKAKEEFYSKNTSISFRCPIDLYNITATEKEQCGEEDDITPFKLASEDLKLLLHPYINDVTTAVLKFKDEYLKDKIVSCVFLTGGASRMDFVRNIFMKVFKLDEKYLPRDNNPSLIVAEGIAHLSYVDYVNEGKKEGFRRTRDAILNNFNWYQELYCIIYPKVKDEIKSKAYSVMCDWKNGHIKGIDEHESNSPTIAALMLHFDIAFNSYRSYDFAKQSNDVIKVKILEKIFSKIKDVFRDYEYHCELEPKYFDVNISARISENGVNSLISKFTGKGHGHIIYDAIWYNSVFMVDFNKYRNRSDSALERHYNYYIKNCYSIFKDSEWDLFLKNDIYVTGVDALKKYVCDYVINETEEYIRYATMSEIFGG